MLSISKLNLLLRNSNNLSQKYDTTIQRLINEYLILNSREAATACEEKVFKDIIKEYKKFNDYDLNKKISKYIRDNPIHTNTKRISNYTLITRYSKNDYQYYEYNGKTLFFNTAPIICNDKPDNCYHDDRKIFFYKHIFFIREPLKLFTEIDNENIIIDSYCLWRVREGCIEIYTHKDERHSCKVQKLELITSLSE